MSTVKISDEAYKRLVAKHYESNESLSKIASRIVVENADVDKIVEVLENSEDLLKGSRPIGLYDDARELVKKLVKDVSERFDFNRKVTKKDVVSAIILYSLS